MGENWTAPRHGDVAGAKRQMFVGRTRTDTALAAARLANTAKLRGRRLIERVHQIAGLRGLVELFEELVKRDLLDETELERRLSRYLTKNRAFSQYWTAALRLEAPYKKKPADEEEIEEAERTRSKQGKSLLRELPILLLHSLVLAASIKNSSSDAVAPQK